MTDPLDPYANAAELDVCGTEPCVLGAGHPGNHECQCGEEWAP